MNRSDYFLVVEGKGCVKTPSDREAQSTIARLNGKYDIKISRGGWILASCHLDQMVAGKDSCTLTGDPFTSLPWGGGNNKGKSS